MTTAKRRWNSAALGALGCFAICALLNQTVRAEKIVFQSTETPPYWSSTMSHDGYAGELLQLVSANAGVDYTLAYLPVKRFRQSQATYIVGAPDLLAHAEHHAIYPIGLFHSALFFYQPHHPALEIHGLKDLRGYTLGVLRGSVDDIEAFRAHGIRVEESDSTESLIKKLRKGRVDLCLVVEGAGRYEIDDHFSTEREQFVSSVIPGLSRPIAIMIDLEQQDGKLISERYRQTLEKTLHSRPYEDIVTRFYGKGHVPADRSAQLDRFVQQYKNTWN